MQDIEHGYNCKHCTSIDDNIVQLESYTRGDVLLRNIDVVMDDINHAFNCVLTRTHVPFSSIYIYLSDRLRALKKQLLIGRRYISHSKETGDVLLCMIKFYSISSVVNKSSPIHMYDPYLNDKHIIDCIDTLALCHTIHESVIMQYQIAIAINTFSAINTPATNASLFMLQLWSSYRLRDYYTFYKLKRELKSIDISLWCLVEGRTSLHFQVQVAEIMRKSYNPRGGFTIRELMYINNLHSKEQVLILYKDILGCSIDNGSDKVMICTSNDADDHDDNVNKFNKRRQSDVSDMLIEYYCKRTGRKDDIHIHTVIAEFISIE